MVTFSSHEYLSPIRRAPRWLAAGAAHRPPAGSHSRVRALARFAPAQRRLHGDLQHAGCAGDHCHPGHGVRRPPAARSVPGGDAPGRQPVRAVHSRRHGTAQPRVRRLAAPRARAAAGGAARRAQRGVRAGGDRRGQCAGERRSRAAGDGHAGRHLPVRADCDRDCRVHAGRAPQCRPPRAGGHGGGAAAGTGGGQRPPAGRGAAARAAGADRAALPVQHAGQRDGPDRPATGPGPLHAGALHRLPARQPRHQPRRRLHAGRRAGGGKRDCPWSGAEGGGRRGGNCRQPGRRPAAHRHQRHGRRLARHGRAHRQAGRRRGPGQPARTAAQPAGHRPDRRRRSAPARLPGTATGGRLARTARGGPRRQRPRGAAPDRRAGARRGVSRHPHARHDGAGRGGPAGGGRPAAADRVRHRLRPVRGAGVRARSGRLPAQAGQPGTADQDRTQAQGGAGGQGGSERRAGRHARRADERDYGRNGRRNDRRHDRRNVGRNVGRGGRRHNRRHPAGTAGAARRRRGSGAAGGRAAAMDPRRPGRAHAPDRGGRTRRPAVLADPPQRDRGGAARGRHAPGFSRQVAGAAEGPHRAAGGEPELRGPVPADVSRCGCRSDDDRRHLGGRLLGAGARGVGVVGRGQRHAHAAAGKRLRLAEQADVGARHAQRIGHAFESDAGRIVPPVNHGRGAGRAQRHVHGQAQDGARVDVEFALHLGGHGDHAGVVRARAHFREPHHVVLDEQLHAEQAQAAQVARDLGGDVLGARQRLRMHAARLPRFHVVALHLHVADRLAELRVDLAVRAQRAHRQQRDFVVEVDKTFDDHAARVHPAAGGRMVPGGLDFGRAVDLRLTLARRRHDRLDHARKTDVGGGRFQLGQAAGKAVRRGCQAQRFGGQHADAFAVHGELGGARGGDAGDLAGRFQLRQRVGGDGFDLRHDQVGLLAVDQRGQRRAVGHVDDVGAVRNLVARRIRITVDGNHFHTQALQGDDDFLAQLARAEQHDTGGGRGQGGAEDACSVHGVCGGLHLHGGVDLGAERRFGLRVGVVGAPFHGDELGEQRRFAHAPFQAAGRAHGQAVLGFAGGALAAEVAGTELAVQGQRVRLVQPRSVTDANRGVVGVRAELIVDVGGQREQAVVVLHQLVRGLARQRVALRRAFARLGAVVVGDLLVLEVAGHDVFVAEVGQLLLGIDLAGHRGADRVTGRGNGAQFGRGAPAVGRRGVDRSGVAAQQGQGKRSDEQGRFHRHGERGRRRGIA
uniref:Uncharacterized protein n=1 Tax=Tanacetum cinerariifolium TaxID=118510 RepID=A0A699GMX0_TANCI|nr:hypothetical protein [Tanacetum cinerariifolium]